MTPEPLGAARRTASWDKRLVGGLFLLAVSAALLEQSLSALSWPPSAVVWASLALCGYALGLMCLVTGAGGTAIGLSRWKFGPWMLLWYGIGFGLATVTWRGAQTGVSQEILLSSVLRALWLVAVGMTVMVVGYRVGPGACACRAAARLPAWLARRYTADVGSLRAPWTLYALGLCARVASVATTGRFGYVGNVSSTAGTATGYGQIIAVLTLCCPLAVAAAALQVYREKIRGARFTLLVLFITEVSFGAAAGGKINFVIAVLAVIIPMTVARYRFPRLAILVCLLAFLVLVIPFNQAYRSAARGGNTSLTVGQAFRAAPSILNQTIANADPFQVLPNSVGYLLERLREIDNPAIIVQRTGIQVAFRSPVQLIDGPLVSVIPRALWPGKPILDVGYQFSQEYYGLPAAVYTSSAISPIGDFYLHGGWVSVIPGMFVLGCGVRLLDDILDVRKNVHAVFLVLLLFPSLVGGEGDWVSLIAGIPGALAVWLLSVALLFRRAH